MTTKNVYVVPKPPEVCLEHGSHCWHEIGTAYSTTETRINRICCWCGLVWEEIIAHTRPGGAFQPDGHPEHGHHAPKQITFQTPQRLYG